jgi:hypothetical protein
MKHTLPHPNDLDADCNVGIIALLGGRCVMCGSHENLGLDELVYWAGRYHRLNRTTALSLRDKVSVRLLLYRAGLLQVLCMPCNSCLGQIRRIGVQRGLLKLPC